MSKTTSAKQCTTAKRRLEDEFNDNPIENKKTKSSMNRDGQKTGKTERMKNSSAISTNFQAQIGKNLPSKRRKIISKSKNLKCKEGKNNNAQAELVETATEETSECRSRSQVKNHGSKNNNLNKLKVIPIIQTRSMKAKV